MYVCIPQRNKSTGLGRFQEWEDDTFASFFYTYVKKDPVPLGLPGCLPFGTVCVLPLGTKWCEDEWVRPDDPKTARFTVKMQNTITYNSYPFTQYQLAFYTVPVGILCSTSWHFIQCQLEFDTVPFGILYSASGLYSVPLGILYRASWHFIQCQWTFYVPMQHCATRSNALSLHFAFIVTGRSRILLECIAKPQKWHWQ